MVREIQQSLRILMNLKNLTLLLSTVQKTNQLHVHMSFSGEIKVNEWNSWRTLNSIQSPV